MTTYSVANVVSSISRPHPGLLIEKRSPVAEPLQIKSIVANTETSLTSPTPAVAVAKSTTWQLFVATPSGTLVVQAPADASVADLKAAVWVRAALPPHVQRLVYEGKQLSDDAARLAAFGVHDCSHLRVALRLCGGAERAPAERQDSQAAQAAPPPNPLVPPTSQTPTAPARASGRPTVPARGTTRRARSHFPEDHVLARDVDMSPGSVGHKRPAEAPPGGPEADATQPQPEAPPVDPALARGTDTAPPLASPASVADGAAERAAPPQPRPTDSGPAFPPGLIFASGSALRLPASSLLTPPTTVRLGAVNTGYCTARGGEMFPSLYLASCGVQRLRDAVDALRRDFRVDSVSGPCMFSGSYGCVSARASPDVAAELAARFNALWASPGPISLASATASRSPPNWWLRPIVGKDHLPADSRWQSHWPIQLVEELTRRGIPSDGVRLSKQGNGVWLSGVDGVVLARAAAAALRLEGAFRTSPGTAIYRLGPVEDPSELTPFVAELALRAILRAAHAQLAAAAGWETDDTVDEYSSSHFTLSPPEVRSVEGADWYVWLGEGGACNDTGTPLVMNQQYMAACDGRQVTVRVSAASAPDRGPTTATSGPRPATKTFAAAAAAARNTAQPLRRAAPPAAHVSPRAPPPRPPPATGPPPSKDQSWQTAGRGQRRGRRRAHAVSDDSDARMHAANAPRGVAVTSESDVCPPARQRRRADSTQATARSVDHRTSGASAAPQSPHPAPPRSAAPDTAVETPAQPPRPAPAAGAAPPQPAAQSPPAPQGASAWPSGLREPAPSALRTVSGRRLQRLGAAQSPSTSAPARIPAPGSREALAARLRSMGLVLGSSLGDGNCLFRAVSDQLNGDDGHGHADIRRIAVAYVRANPQAYSGFLTDAEFDDFLAKMSAVGESAGEVEIDAISKHYGRSVVVHQMRQDLPPLMWLRGDTTAPPLQLAYREGSASGGGHYDTVRYLNDAARADWISRLLPVSGQAESPAAAPEPVAPGSAAAPSPVDALQTAAPAPAVAPLQVAVPLSAVAPLPAVASPTATPPPASSPAAPPAVADPAPAAPQRCPHMTGNVKGMCAPTAIARGLMRDASIQCTPEDVQRAVTGSDRPSAWLPAHFIEAARRFKVVLTVCRDGGHVTQSIGAGPLKGLELTPRVFLQLNRNGTHVEVARNVPADALYFSRMPDQYVDVGTSGDAWKQEGRLRVLVNVRAESAAPAVSSAAATSEAYGRCTGVVPNGTPEIKTLMAALPCNLPGHVDGWMRKQAFHLHRILAAEPRPEDGFVTDGARWRYEMAVLGPKMEYTLLRHAAAIAGTKWAQGLGAALPRVRAILPPLDEPGWSTWDGTSLLEALRRAVDAESSAPPRTRAGAAAGDGICSLLERGRIPAARAALYGEAVLSQPPPSEAMRAELQAKNPQPAAQSDVVSEEEWQRAAAECEALRRDLRDERQVSADDLLAAARTQRAGAAAGPDGWSGGYLRRLATLFPTEAAELLWREFRTLSDTFDPLAACVVADATVGGIAKPRGGFRPIAIGRCVVRCIVAHLVKRARPDLRRLLERGDQFGLTGVLPAVVKPLKMMVKCAHAGVPWALTDDDFTNAFNAVSQRALFDAARRVAPVAPELAACMLRAQCMIRGGGSAEMVMRGRYRPGSAEPYVVERYARGGGQGCPDMPAAFAEVVAALNVEAEASMGDVRGDMTTGAMHEVLWPLVREQARLPAWVAAPDAWTAALDRLMDMPRPRPHWGSPRGEASSAYADDTHSGGWAVACIVKSLRRVAAARARAALSADPLKCKVLTSAALKPDLDALLEPLRGGDARAWEVVTSMRVLGVTLSDPTDRASLEAAVVETLRVRVIAPVNALIAELAVGAKPSTAYFALVRFVLPNALYHMQVWGLLCSQGAWAEVDDALTRFCEALCPVDLRHRLAPGAGLAGLRAELSLPQRFGGLGIPRVAAEAPHRAAEQWDHRDALEAGMLPAQARVAYQRPSGPLSMGAWAPVGMNAHFDAVADALADAEPRATAREAARRRERNRLRSALWAFSAVPWVPELALDHTEWDVMWRLTFGGMSAAMRARLDHPADGFAYRGRRMEYAVMEAIEEAVPAGALRIASQPAPERIPVNHAERCARDGTSPDGWKRADIAVAFITGKTVTLDVRTTNTLAASALAVSSAATHLTNLENAKIAKYVDYYRDFVPFVIDLSGAVTERTFGALKNITREAAKAARPRLHWEQFDWAVRMQRRIAVAMVRTVAYLATRVPARADVPGCRAGLGRGPSDVERMSADG